MRAEDLQRFIRRIATENHLIATGDKVFWSRHAVAELVDDELQRSQVESALQNCKVIEEYPASHRPLPDCLVLAFLSEGEPMHAVVAADEANDRIFVVTVYVPSVERWHNDWQTRK